MSVVGVYYGSETKKAKENFHISGKSVDARWIRAIVMVKIAAAQANIELDCLEKKVGKAIIRAGEEILTGKFLDQFITDGIQGGAGTSMHMNVNEVIATRAKELLDNTILVHPLDHVNMSQSTNDVVPTALRIVFLELIDEYIAILQSLRTVCRQQGKRLHTVMKVGRTHLQDAVPISLGQEFSAYASFFRRDIRRFKEVKAQLLITNLGGTAIGTMVNSSSEFVRLSHHFLRDISGYALTGADDLVDATQNVDPLIQVSQTLELSMLTISKIMNDLRFMASGPRAGLAEIKLPELQKGSSIMPGKVNPVMFEAVNQVAYVVSGAAQTGRMVLLSGQFELNVMLPVFGKQMIESFEASTHVLENTLETLEKIQPNTKQCQKMVEQSMVYAPLLNGKLGYDQTSKLVKRAVKHGKTLREEMRDEHILGVIEGDEKK